jgi:hypothetical protein
MRARELNSGSLRTLHPRLFRDSGLRADIYLAGDDPLDHWGLAHRRREKPSLEAEWRKLDA